MCALRPRVFHWSCGTPRRGGAFVFAGFGLKGWRNLCLRGNIYQRGITGQKHSRAMALALTRAYIAPCFFLLPPPLFPPLAARRREQVAPLKPFRERASTFSGDAVYISDRAGKKQNKRAAAKYGRPFFLLFRAGGHSIPLMSTESSHFTAAADTVASASSSNGTGSFAACTSPVKFLLPPSLTRS